MSAIPDGWKIGARLRRFGDTEGVIVYVGHEFAVLDTDGGEDALAYFHAGWELAPPVPPIPEDVGTIVLRRNTVGRLAVRYDEGWYQDGDPAFGWKPDPADWQQLVPKEQQP